MFTEPYSKTLIASRRRPLGAAAVVLLLASLLSACLLSGCLGSGNNCPPLQHADGSTVDADSLFPPCSGHVEPQDAMTGSDLPDYNREMPIGDSTVILKRITQNGQRDEGTPILRHHYSRRQAWNADETLIDLNRAILYASTLEPHPAGNPFSSERLWSNVDPSTMFGIRFNPTAIEFASYDVNTLTHTPIHRFEDYKHCTIGKAEGNLSNDDKRIVFTCSKPDDKIDIVVYDIENRRILGTREAAPNLNWASITPSGRFVVVENNTHPDPDPVLLRYGADMQQETLLMEHPSHGDLALDDGGNDVHVMIDSDTIFYVRIKDRLKVRLPINPDNIRFRSGHISCRNLQRPGWCYLSAYNSGHIGAVKIGVFEDIDQDLAKLDSRLKEGVNAYEHWTLHNSSSKNYRAEAKASVSPTGRQIIFSSDWQGQSAVEEYMLTLPAVTP